jgi:alanine dehydrogenase
VKIVNVHPDNPSKGLPTVMALMILNSPSNGKPLAVMDGGYLTALRTGAAGGIAARYLAREDSKVLGIVGAGGQARTQLEAIAQVFSLEQVKVFDVDASRSEVFRSQMGGIVNCNMSICKDIREACDCDILVTVTPVRKPLIMDDWIRPGTHINAIGADARGKEELEPALLTRSRIVVDDITQAVHSGEVNVPISEGIIKVADIVCELGEVIAGLHPGRTDDSQITIFDSTGLAIQDVSTAHLAYNRALELGMGMDLDMF